MTGPDGRFVLTTSVEGERAVAGPYTVGVTQADVVPPPMPGEKLYEASQKLLKRVDPRCADPAKSGLTASVPDGGTDELEIRQDPPSGR